MVKSLTKLFKVRKDGIGLNLFSDFKYLLVLFIVSLGVTSVKELKFELG